MKTLTKLFSIGMIALCTGTGLCATDQEVEEWVSNVFYSIHGERGYVTGGLRMCEYNSNRFVRILFNMVTNYPEHASYCLGYIGRYGTTNDVPFLESYVTNAECGYSACNSILRLSGLNSNSLHCASLYNSLTNETIRSCDLFNVIVKWSNRDDISAENKSLGMDYAWNFASNATFLTEYIDLTLREYLPSYTNGTTRSDFLNHRLTLGISNIDRAYIFNVLEHIQNEPDWILNRPRSTH